MTKTGGLLADSRTLTGGLFLLALLFCSCEKEAPRTPVQEGNVLEISRSDEEFNQIIRRVRETLPEFTEKLKSPGADEGNFQVKYPFEADPGSGFAYEHIWLRDIRFEDNAHYGIVSNQPAHCGGLIQGAEVPFQIDRISDWMYTRGEKIIGGFSIKFLMEHIPGLDQDAEIRAHYEKFQ